MKLRSRVLVVTTLVMATTGFSLAEEPVAKKASWLAAGTVAAEPAEYQKPIPVTFSLDYTLVSDYMWRGQNLTRFSHKPSHQGTVGAEVDLGSFGRVGGNVWFQFQQDYNTSGCLMEVDYTAYYGYTIEAIGLDIEVGFIYYEFPHIESGNTQEIYASFSWDDSILWRALGLDVKEPILNPFASFYFDIDEAGGVYGEVGISHEFALADMGCKDVPVLKDMTFGLSWTMGWANDWAFVNDYDGPMTSQYGMTLGLDLKEMLSIPDQYCGGLSLTGFLNYNHPLTNNGASYETMMDHNLWGGLSISYEW